MKLAENWYYWPWFVFYFVNQGYIKVVSCLCSNQGWPGGGVVVYQYTHKIPEYIHNFPKDTQNCKECSILRSYTCSFYISELWRGGGESSPPPSVFEAQKMTSLKPRAGASLCKLSAGSLDRNKAVAPQYLLTLAMSSCWFRIHPNLSRHNTLCPKLVVSKANDILSTQISA